MFNFDIAGSYIQKQTLEDIILWETQLKAIGKDNFFKILLKRITGDNEKNKFHPACSIVKCLI